MTIQKPEYGVGNASFLAAGGVDGITSLVNAFYEQMDLLPEARRIRAMHSSDLTESRRKLTYFLSGWLGGPSLYQQHYGSIAIPLAHRHLDVNSEDVDAWLLCMRKALASQPYEDDFKQYMIEQLSVPATRIRQACGN